MTLIVRIRTPHGPSYGFLESDTIRVASGALWDLHPTDMVIAHAKAHMLAPLEPYTIFAVGRNYAAHVAELDNDMPREPFIFYKPVSSVIAPGEPIIYPRWSSLVHHEGELAVVVGHTGRNLTVEQAGGVIFGYTIANDVSARDAQKKDGQWWRAKGADTFCPLGPVIVPADELSVDDVQVRTSVNGQVRQDASTALLIFSIPTVIAYISHAVTLHPGDVILTGTPSGVGPLMPGDTVTVSIPGIGELTNPVVGEG